MVFANGLARALEVIDDDDEDFLLLLLLCSAKKKRRVKWMYERIDWNSHMNKCEYTNTFQSRYHMTKASFDKLVNLLRPVLASNELQSIRSTRGNDPITPEMTVGAGLRFLGGELVKSIADIYGMSDASAHRIINNFLVAADQCPELAIKLPTTDAELKKCADDWNKVSGALGIYYGTVGAIDGWLCCIQSPRDKNGSISNSADYYSGHYQRYGLNVQAMCDSNLRFIYFGVISPGRTNDARAFNCRCLALGRWVDSLPDEYFIIGDNAYPLSDKLLIPFSGGQKHQEYNRTYNFYLSQLRIRIEMAFGRLSTKWRIFRRNLDFELDKISMICRVAARLHNYVIDEDSLQFDRAEDLEDFGVNRLTITPGKRIPENNRGYLPNPPSQEDNNQAGIDERRQSILAKIIERDMRRPIDNLLRNNELDDETVYDASEN